LFLALTATLFATPPAAQERGELLPETLFKTGNEAYSKGDFAAAQKAYRGIVDLGIRNSRVYYNLGNACFRRNEIGSAILYYEKTLRLQPGDVDARENLRFASLRIRDRIPPDSTPFLITLLSRGVNLLSLEQVTGIFLVTYFTAMAALSAWIGLRRTRWSVLFGGMAGILLLSAMTAGGWMVLQAHARNATDEAIVLLDKLDVYSGPGSDNTLLASVHEGTKVRVHARRDPWIQVTLPDGRSGWLLGEALGVI
ncbi:MAG: tetratricopeptide repeat protein, partial [Acidobacteria bacterium]|nr:tetratricopeptide repeat protein [Acidobacteriota bacterium]